jgi:radical SAM-linked protein
MSAARRVPEGPAPEPAVQKLRVRYAKRGRMRFTSSRDFQRALERGLRLAGVPMAYSAGFHPHPRISYANAAPTGVASEAEYVELSVTRVVDPAQVAEALDAALPDGLDIVHVVEAGPGALADLLQASRWQLVFGGLAVEELEGVVADFLARESVRVTRMMKQGPRAIDVRTPVVNTEVTVPDSDRSGAALLLTVRHTTPTVRPAEVWAALCEVSGRDLPRPASARLMQGTLREDGTIVDRFA